MMAEKYGKLPTEVAEIHPSEYTRLQRFRINQRIFYATEQHKEKHRNDPGSSGVGTEAEKNELVQNQIDRADDEHGSIAAQKSSV